MKRFWTHVAALVGALIGFYAGLAALLAAGGLGSAGWAPLFMGAGSGLVAGGAVAVIDQAATLRLWVIGALGGLAIGALLTAIDPDATIVAIVLAIFSQALAALPGTGRDSPAGP